MNNNKGRLKVLLIAYACEPNAISEPYLSWETIRSLAKRSELSVTVLTRVNNLADCMLESERQGLEIRWVGIDCFKLFLILKRYFKNITTQAYALLWQYRAIRHIRKLLRAEDFDVIHGISFMSVFNFAAGACGRPAIIGPIGGGQRIPSVLGVNSRQEFIRSFMLRVLPSLPGWRRSMYETNRIIVANKETLEYVVVNSGIGRNKVSIRQPGFPGNESNSPALKIIRSGPVKLFWGSRLERWKGLELLLEGCAEAIKSGIDLRLDITGRGGDASWLESLSDSLGLRDRVQFHGHVSYERLCELRGGAEILCFTSLRETTGLALLEMLSTGRPVMVVDTGGPSEIIKNINCLRIRPAHARADVVSALKNYCNNPEEVVRSALKSLPVMREIFSWDKYIYETLQLYSEVAENKLELR